jgi:internalin A
MAISTEGKLGILAGLVGIGGAGAIMVWPDHLEIGWTLIGIAALGGIVLAAYHFRDVHRDRRQKERMAALAGFIVFGLASLACGYLYFRPVSTPAIADSVAVAQLTALGWGVQPEKDGIRFEVSGKPLPPMKQSADLFRRLGTSFSLRLQSLSSLDGFHYLSDLQGCKKVEISAGTFIDISELKDFRYLEELVISQTPSDGRNSVDFSPLTNLTSLLKLNLNFTKVTSIQLINKLRNLKELYLRDTWIGDLSPLADLPELEILDITDTRATNLAPLSHNTKLVELGVGARQIPGLAVLSQLETLKKLRIIAQMRLDLTPIGSLHNLEYLWIWGGAFPFDVSPLRQLKNLQDLTLSGLGMGTLAPVENISAIGELDHLKRVTFGQLEINDLSFVEGWHDLNEINLSEMPIPSLEPLRGHRELRIISIHALPVADISPLLDLPNLTELRLMRTPARADLIALLQRRGVKVDSN